MTTTIPTSVRTKGGPWDVVYFLIDSAGSVRKMGFRTEQPAPKFGVSNLAPNIQVGGGESAFAADGFQQAKIEGFEVGGDLELWESGENRYRWSDGNVALHVEGKATLASQWSAVDASKTATAPRIMDFVPNLATQAYVVIGCGTVLRKYDANAVTWSDESPVGGFTTNVIHLYSTETYLFVSLGASVDALKWNGTPGAAGWSAVLAGVRATCFCCFNQKLYRGLANNVYVTADLTGGAGWGAAVPVGLAGTIIEDLYEAYGYLCAAKPEGLYISSDGAVWTRLMDAKDFTASGNYVCGKDWRGAVYASELVTIGKFTIVGGKPGPYTDITPLMKGSNAKEKYGHGRPVCLFSGPRRLYAALNGGEGLYPELLSYNGLGWHQLYRGASGATMHAAGYSALMGWLLVNDGSTRRKRILNTGDGEYSDYAATGQFTIPKFDAGCPDEPKAFRSLSVKTKNCSALRTVGLEYSIEDGTWTSMGDAITSDGVKEVSIGQVNASVRGKDISFRVTLTRDPAVVTEGPEIEWPAALRYLVRPQSNDAIADTLLLDEETDLQNNFGGGLKVGDAYKIEEMNIFVDDMIDTPDTVIRRDEFNRSSRVVFTSWSADWKRLPQSYAEKQTVALKALDMFPGVRLWDDVDVKVGITASVTLFDVTSAYGHRSYGFYTYGA